MPPKLHFFIVDDLPIIRRIVATFLKTLGHIRVSEAEDGEQALKPLQAGAAAGTPINFVVTDWNMPLMDGLELLQAIRATVELQHLPVLVVTNEMAEDHIVAMMQAGADGYLVKPLLNAETLKQALAKILLRREMA